MAPTWAVPGLLISAFKQISLLLKKLQRELFLHF